MADDYCPECGCHPSSPWGCHCDNPACPCSETDEDSAEDGAS